MIEFSVHTFHYFIQYNNYYLAKNLYFVFFYSVVSLILYYCQYLDREGKVRPEKPDKDFRGTTQYASPFVHIHNADQCPRDDLFSLFFVMADMLCGQVQWKLLIKLPLPLKVFYLPFIICLCVCVCVCDQVAVDRSHEIQR